MKIYKVRCPVGLDQNNNLLDNLSRQIKQSYKDSVTMLKFMGALEFILDNSLVKPFQEQAAM